ncbi:MAG: MlaD family protein [Alphaproteobacteria bacterium]
MENQSRYFRVGLFVLFVMGLFLFIAVRFYGTKVVHYNDYGILFQKDIGGLAIGSDVTLQGISVGSVKDIRLLEDEVTVEVVIQVQDRFVVREDTVASLQLTSISGAVKVQLENRGFSEEPLVATPYQEFPLIASDNSTIEQIVNGLPAIVGTLNDIMTQISTLLSEKNVASTTNIIDNFDNIAKNLSAHSQDIDLIFKQTNNILANLEEGTKDIATLKDNTNQLVANVDKTVSGELKQTLEEAKRTLSQLTSTLSQIQNNTLPKLEQTLQAGNSGLESVGSLGGKLSDNPTSIIKEPKYKGYSIVE